MKVKMCDHIDISGVKNKGLESVFAICKNQFVIYSCKKCYEDKKFEIISKKEFEKYLIFS